MIRNNRFQNHICESTATLPVCIAAGILLWFLTPGSLDLEFSGEHIVSLLLCSLTTYVVMETNNVNMLIRIRTRMVATVWVVLCAVTPVLHVFSRGIAAALCLASSHYLLFRTYQRHDAMADTFHSFVFLGAACLWVPQLLVLVPLYCFYMAVFLRCITWRMLCAGIVGLLFPLWLLVGYCFLLQDFSALADVYNCLVCSFQPHLEDYAGFLSLQQPTTVTIAYITLLGLICMIHLMRTYYNDKIRTRMLLYIYIGQAIATWAILIVNPGASIIILPVILVCVSPLIAHFFALTGTIVSNLFFCLNLMGVAALLLFNQRVWMY